MEFSEIEVLKTVTRTAVAEWEKYAAALNIHDNLLPTLPNAARWSLEEDFRLFAEFWEPDPEDQDRSQRYLISKVATEWIIDRTTRWADRNPLERRASIIMGDEFFFGPDKVEHLLGFEFPEIELAKFKMFPREAEMREKRQAYILFYGCSMTDHDLTLLISEHLTDSDLNAYAKKKMRHPKTVIRSGWQFAPIFGMEEAGEVDISWPTAFAYMLFQLSRKSVLA